MASIPMPTGCAATSEIHGMGSGVGRNVDITAPLKVAKNEHCDK
jgi:hypothetical protein